MSGYILNAPEATYGAGSSTGWRDTGINADNLKARQDLLERKTLTRRTGAPKLAGRRIIDKGGEGDLQIDVGTNGLGMYLKPAASTSASDLVEDAEAAYLQRFTWTDAGPPSGAGCSIVSEVYRERQSGEFDPWSFKGGKPTKWALSQDLSGFLVLTLTMDYLSAVLLGSDPGRTPTTPDVSFQYAWPDALITLTPLTYPAGVRTLGTPETECLSSFSLEVDLAVDAEAWCLKRGTTKHEPKRASVPAPTGTIEWKYQHPRYWTAFRNGTPFNVTAQWQAPVAIETVEGSPVYPSLEIGLGTIVFQEPNDPESKVDGPTEQSMPFVVVDDEQGDPVITWDQVTSDAAL